MTRCGTSAARTVSAAKKSLVSCGAKSARIRAAYAANYRYGGGRNGVVTGVVNWWVGPPRRLEAGPFCALAAASRRALRVCAAGRSSGVALSRNSAHGGSAGGRARAGAREADDCDEEDQHAGARLGASAPVRHGRHAAGDDDAQEVAVELGAHLREVCVVSE